MYARLTRWGVAEMARIPSLQKRMHSSMSKADRFVMPVDRSTLPRGYLVATTYAGIKKAISPSPATDAAPQHAPKPDMTLLVSSAPASVAGTFTSNKIQAAPVVHSTKALQAQGPHARARAVLVNSGCANAVTGQGGYEDTEALVKEVRKYLPTGKQSGPEIPSDVLMMSTGVIGVRLPLPQMLRGIQHLMTGQVLQSNPDAWLDMARAFMTTDTFPKLRTRQFKLGNRLCSIAAIDKGAGMIHPRMASPGGLHATLLGMFATDAPVATPTLQRCLEEAVRESFNCISVDGDMSTNDTILALANGQAPMTDSGSPVDGEISEATHPELVSIFAQELKAMSIEMAHLIVRDGEGAEKFVQVRVKNAGTYEQAHAIASSISTSALVKCAMHGEDANWGRILCAAGYAAVPASSPEWSLDLTKVNVTFVPPPSASNLSPIHTLKNGVPQPVDEAKAAELLAHEDIYIDMDLQGGSWEEGACAEAVFWTCDFSKEYITVRCGCSRTDQWRLPNLGKSSHNVLDTVLLASDEHQQKIDQSQDSHYKSPRGNIKHVPDIERFGWLALQPRLHSGLVLRRAKTRKSHMLVEHGARRYMIYGQVWRHGNVEKVGHVDAAEWEHVRGSLFVTLNSRLVCIFVASQ